MITDKQDKKDKRERKCVQRVLHYHNKKYRAHIEIKDKSIEVYPELEGQINWDWVCYDTKKGAEIAVEVKRITKQELENKAKAVYGLLHEVRMTVLPSLAGEFLLSVNIPDNYIFPLRKQPPNKQIFKKVLFNAVAKTSQRLSVGDKEDLKSQISDGLPFELPNIMFFDLTKLNDKGNMLLLNPMVGHSWPIGFDKLELEKFRDLVSLANAQLKAAQVKETFLVLIEEGYRPADPPEIAEAFENINSESYSEIRHVYFVRGREVTEILLPTP